MPYLERGTVSDLVRRRTHADRPAGAGSGGQQPAGWQRSRQRCARYQGILFVFTYFDTWYLLPAAKLHKTEYLPGYLYFLVYIFVRFLSYSTGYRIVLVLLLHFTWSFREEPPQGPGCPTDNRTGNFPGTLQETGVTSNNNVFALNLLLLQC